MKKRYKLLLSLGILGLLLIAGLLHFVAPYMIIKRNRISCHISNRDNVNPLLIYSSDSVALRGVEVEAKDTKLAMILLHGIGGNHCHFLGTGEAFAANGISSLVFSHRGHGESGGEYCTFGYYEKEDVSKLVDYLENKYPGIKIGVWGHSLGAAIAIQAMANDERIDFGIAESPFANLHEVVNDYQKRIFGFGSSWVSNYALTRAEEIAEFDASKVSPVTAAKKITQAIFISHGTEDKRINFSCSQAIFNNIKSDEKTFYPINGAGHNNLFKQGGTEYQEALSSFMNKQMEREY